MSDPQQRVEALVSKFQSDLVALAGELASDTIASALGATNGHSNGHVSAPRHEGNSKNGAKRDPKVLAELGDRFSSFVKAHPGLRIEQINKQMGSTTQALALPIRKLIASGAIKVKGTKRSTTYFAGAAIAVAPSKEAKQLKKKRSASGVLAKRSRRRR